MAEESGSTKCIEYDDANDFEQIQKLQILGTLLECLKDVQGEYSLSAVLEYSSEQYSRGIMLQGILQLAKEEYIIIKSSRVMEQEDEESISVKQLIDEEEYDNILIALKEKEIGILLRNFVDASISMLEMRSQVSKVAQKISDYETRLTQYEKHYETINDTASKVNQDYEKFKNDRVNLENKYTSDWSRLEQRLTSEQESFKESVLEEAKQTASDLIDKELAQSGRIGSAMQDTQKSIIQFMAIFVAIFSLVSINITNAGKWCYAELFRVNVIMTASMFTLTALIFVFTTNNTDRIKRLLAVVAVIWIALAVSAGVSICFS